MEKKKVPCAPKNLMQGRNGFRPEAIVLHRTGGSEEQIRVRFLDASTLTSSHYLVAKTGAVSQFVQEKDTAFHAGQVVNPSWQALKPNVNPNFYTLGIELEGAPTDAIPEEQAEACAALVAEIAARLHFTIDSQHVVLHSEIRASRACPGDNFDRESFLRRALEAGTRDPILPLSEEVQILRDTNVREALPSATARIVSVLRAGSTVQVTGYTLAGEAIDTNQAWFRTAEGDFVWAGDTTTPQPRPVPVRPIEDDASQPVPAGPIPLHGPAPSGVDEIDQFFANKPCAPISLDAASPAAVQIVQDLLTCHGCANVPSTLSPSHGVVTPATLTALRQFQISCGLPLDTSLTADCVKQLTTRTAANPICNKGYISLVMGENLTELDYLLSITAQMEGGGRFAALNRNSDKAGLSFGLIQWAQSEGRLLEIVKAFRTANQQAFTAIFGDGDAVLAEGLLAHLAKSVGGVVKGTGLTTDPQFDLISPQWCDRFTKAALLPEFQKVQLDIARADFQKSLDRLRVYDAAGIVKSERGVAFMLDVANQYGDATATAGAGRIYREVVRPGMTEQELLLGVANEAGGGPAGPYRNRRQLFLTTPLLSSTKPFRPLAADVTEAAAIA